MSADDYPLHDLPVPPARLSRGQPGELLFEFTRRSDGELIRRSRFSGPRLNGMRWSKRMTDYQERIKQFLADTQSRIAPFAQESYRAHGRGLVKVAIPDSPELVPGLAMTDMVYHKLDSLRELFAGVGKASREDAAITLRMVETYDPDRQAVVMVAADGLPAVTVKLRLQPLAVPESDSVN